MRAVLDTNIYVDFARGRPDVVNFLAIQSTEILLPAIVMGELFYGFIIGKNINLTPLATLPDHVQKQGAILFRNV
jgi:predicted nucleic acid-binding protein